MEAGRLSLLCVDVGSTRTKAVLLEESEGRLLGRASAATTVSTDVLEGMERAIRALRDQGHAVPEPDDPDRAYVCSSAGGGLRLAVVGHERQVTAEAGRRVGLSAGAQVVHVAAGRLDGAAVTGLRADRPDVVLLVGGTDGGNAEVLLHNAGRLAAARLGAPVVVAGNRDAREDVAAQLTRTGRRHVLTDNVLPRIGVVEPGPARRAIRDIFLRHVIGGKGLSRGPRFARMVRAATPDTVLAGVEVLAAAGGADVLVVDVGGATTDVYSVLQPQGEDAALRKDVVPTLWQSRTVEGDLGVRWSAPGVLAAAEAEGLTGGLCATRRQQLDAWVRSCREVSSRLPADAGEEALDLALAGFATQVAVRRHARPVHPGEQPRPLTGIAWLVGSGGVLRHAAPDDAAALLSSVLDDHGGGWRPPSAARPVVDRAYLLLAAGLLAETRPGLAAAVAARVLDPGQDRADHRPR